MKILMFPHHLEIGGSQTNCIDWATELRASFGHEVLFCATPGPAAEIIRERGFRLIELARPRRSPSVTLTWAVLDVARRERPDILHAFEWPQILDAFYGAHLQARVPLLGTVLSMTVQSMLPRSIPVTYGSRQMVEGAKQINRGPVYLLEPPVDTQANAPGAGDGARFREELGVGRDSIAIVVVSRLISWLKAEGLFRAIDSVSELYKDHDLRLIIVGGGPMEDELRHRAEDCNRRSGGEAVTLTGPILDPRAAYDGADIMLGMGGSVMRGMAFRKPCIVLGERGFSAILDPGTLPAFLEEGFYGLGCGVPDDLTGQMRSLIESPDLRRSLGEFARNAVVAHLGIEQSTVQLVRMYEDTIRRGTRLHEQIGDGASTLARRLASLMPDGFKHTVRDSVSKVRA